jgi:NADH-quinone oxidoreductase subunit G
VTARKDQWGEVEDWICNTCRFEKKSTSDWVVEGPTKVSRHSVISQGHYLGLEKPTETFSAVHGGRAPKLLMDIHSVSEVNRPGIELSAIPGPATSDTFNQEKK